LPPPQAVYWILASCLSELMRVGLVEPLVRAPLQQSGSKLTHAPQEMLDWRSAASLRQEGANVQSDGSALAASRSASLKLWDLSVLCEVRVLFRSRRRKLTPTPTRALRAGHCGDCPSWRTRDFSAAAA